MEDKGERVVVGLDDSAGGREALRFALCDAARRGARVQVIAAFEIPQYWESVYAGVATPADHSLDELRDAVQADAARIVAEVREQVTGDIATLPPVTITSVGGSAADALLRASHGADLLVVGSRGRGGFASMVLGSVSMQCVLHATCPVTVVHASGARVPAAEHAGEQAGEQAAPATA